MFESEKQDYQLIIDLAKNYPEDLIDPQFMPSTDTGCLQMLAKVMKIDPSVTMSLVVKDFAPNSFNHTEVEFDLI